jgi:NADH-quinone oxidoreductase subunit C
MLDGLADFPRLQRALDFLTGKFGDSILASAFEKKELAVRVKRKDLLPILAVLKYELGFNALDDIIGLDNLRSAAEGAPRFSLLYQLYEFPGFSRLRISVDVGEGEAVDSVTSLYKSANWVEREIFDLLGIHFSAHPDLRRIYMPEEFEGHPLRKDFPLEGKPDGV